MNGIIIINKPKDYTSRDVVNKLNHIFHTKKIGHTGTLDPIATGVLVCCIGSYTKLVNELTSFDKEYVAEIKLGIKTDTGDITGSILKENNNYNITKEDILSVFSCFPKEYEQTVPKYSAIKINGKKLYEYARQNINVELPKRNVSIYNLDLIDFNNDIIKFKTRVSKGTYIRSLIEDICEKLNVYGTMNSLERTKQGKFDILDSIKLEDIKETTKLLSADEYLNIKDISVEKDINKLVINGNKLNINVNDGFYNIIYNDCKVAIYHFVSNEGKLVMFYS